MTANPKVLYRPDPGVGDGIQSLDFGLVGDGGAGIVSAAAPWWVRAGTKIAFPLTLDNAGVTTNMKVDGTPTKVFDYKPTSTTGPIVATGLCVSFLWTGACDPANFGAGGGLSTGIQFQILDTGGTAFADFVMPTISHNAALMELLDKAPHVGATTSTLGGSWQFPAAILLNVGETFRVNIRDDISGYAITELSMRLIGVQLPANT